MAALFALQTGLFTRKVYVCPRRLICLHVRCDLIRKRSGLPIFVPTPSAAHDVSIWRSSNPSRAAVRVVKVEAVKEPVPSQRSMRHTAHPPSASPQQPRPQTCTCTCISRKPHAVTRASEHVTRERHCDAGDCPSPVHQESVMGSSRRSVTRARASAVPQRRRAH
jgi:hypothetical protein